MSSNANKDLETIQKQVERSIDLLQKLSEYCSEKRVDCSESEWYNKGIADAYDYALLYFDDIRVHINTLKEINDGITGE